MKNGPRNGHSNGQGRKAGQEIRRPPVKKPRLVRTESPSREWGGIRIGLRRDV